MDTEDPLQVMIMDDDYCALKLNAALLMRDPRTTVCDEAETPAELLSQVAKAKVAPDAIVLDTEYEPPEPPVGVLIRELRTRAPGAVVVCLSQYGNPAVVRSAISAGARGFLLKNEIRMAIVAAVKRACRARFVMTPGIKALLPAEFYSLLQQADTLNSWEPHPDLTPRLERSVWLHLVYGMRAPLVAQEIDRKTETVERYVSDAYVILQDDWADDTDLEGLDLDALKAEDRAFILFTAPPRVKRSGRGRK